MKHTVNVKLQAPFKPEDLREFLASIPEESNIAVIVFEGGSQRDPYPVAYGFTAQWGAAE